MFITRKQYNEDIENAVRKAMGERDKQQWIDDRFSQFSCEIGRLERRIAEMEMRHYSTKEKPQTDCMCAGDMVG